MPTFRRIYNATKKLAHPNGYICLIAILVRGAPILSQ
jgi:hypothetical protein